MADQNSFLIYQDDNGVSNVNVRFEGEDVWLAAEQIQVLFQASRQDVAYHIEQIYADGELQQESTSTTATGKITIKAKKGLFV